MSFKLDAKSGTAVLLNAMLALQGVMRRYGAIMLLVTLLIVLNNVSRMETTPLDAHTDAFELNDATLLVNATPFAWFDMVR